MSIDCSEVRKFAGAYVDGEFADDDRAEVERHLSGCAACRAAVRVQARLKAAVRVHLPRPALPDALASRVRALLAAEPEPRTRAQRIAWRAVPAAIAASLLLALTWGARRSPVIEDSIARHRRNLPLEVAGPDHQVQSWFRDKVDFAVRPPHFRSPAVRLVGGRLSNIRERQAAYLLYEKDGSKVSVFVFDPGELPLEAARRMRVRDREFYFDESRGYRVALFRSGGIGYSVTSEMPESEMIRLISSVEP